MTVEVVVAGVGIHPFGRFDDGYRKLGVRNRLAAVHALDGLDTLEQPA